MILLFNGNLSTSKRGQGMQEPITNRLLVKVSISEVPLRSSESSRAMSRKIKSLTKIFLRLQRRLARPFAEHCNKDMMQWLRVPRWPFTFISIVTPKKMVMIIVARFPGKG